MLTALHNVIAMLRTPGTPVTGKDPAKRASPAYGRGKGPRSPAPHATALAGVLLLGVFSLLLLVPLEAFACKTSPSQPGTAIFYPDEALLTVEESLAPVSLPSGRSAFVLVLPSGVKKDTFALTIDGVPAQGYYWPGKEEREAILESCGNEPVPGSATLPENEPSAQRRALLEQLVPLSADVAFKQGALNATNTRISLLQKSLEIYGPSEKSEVSPADEAAKLSAIYSEQYPALYADAAMQARAVKDAREKLARAENALRDFDLYQSGNAVVIPHDAQGKEKRTLRYAYVLPASCNIHYRLDARPDEGEFSLAQDVELAQNTGFSWDNVELHVSTVRRDKTLHPANIQPWRISLRPIAVPRPMAKYAGEAVSRLPEARSRADESELFQAAVAQDEAGQMAAPSPAPLQEDRGTFRIWTLGRQSIAHGTPVTLPLASDVHKAAFHYTLRPASSPMGFLTAKLSLPAPLELPPGMAQFSVNGAGMGRQPFSFNGNTGIIFFGSDPQVTATMRDLKQTSGEQGFFTKEATRSWHWQITLKNSRPKAVEIELEDAAPVKEVETVNIITQSIPKPEEVVLEPKYGGAHIYRWKISLNPGESRIIDHQIQVVAPRLPDKEISPGR